MYEGPKDEKSAFVASIKAQREARELEQRRAKAAVSIQAWYRGTKVRSLVVNQWLLELRDCLKIFNEFDRTHPLPKAVDGFAWMRRYLLIARLTGKPDTVLLQQLCRYSILSSEVTDFKTSCIACALTAQHLLIWVDTIKRLLYACILQLSSLAVKQMANKDLPSDHKAGSLYLHMLVVFTATNTWALLKAKQGEALRPTLNQLCANIMADLVKKGSIHKMSQYVRAALCRSCPTLKPESLKAVIMLSIRALTTSNFHEDTTVEFVEHIFGIPALVHHVSKMAPQSMQLLEQHDLFARTITVLNTSVGTQLLHKWDAAATLCLLANCVQLADINKQILVANLLDFANMLTRLLDRCQNNSGGVAGKRTANTAHWHPVLGWFSSRLDEPLQQSMPFVIGQLQLLWSPAMVQCLFRQLLTFVEAASRESNSSQSSDRFSSGSASHTNEFVASAQKLFRKMVESQKQAMRSGNRGSDKFESAETTVTALVCSLYQSSLHTFTQLKVDILAGLCRDDFLLPKLWHFITSLGAQDGLKPFLDALAHNPKATNPEFQILSLFCDTAATLLTLVDNILDEQEMYEQQVPFQLTQITAMARFCNVFCFKAIWDSIIDVKSVDSHQLYNSVHNLCMVLYYRDCRRKYTPSPKFWLVTDVKASTFATELKRENKRARLLMQRIPHMLPHKERVLLLRSYIQQDRERLGIESSSYHPDFSSNPTAPLITVYRQRLVEDGYRQLSLLDNNELKGTIRVKFVNEQGLDEAGIDQHGVFKEFLEESIKKVFDPSLCLFKSTSEARLYPSPHSNVHENHLSLFDFVGRMLAKAIYEGIVIDVPFAHFFLANILGRRFSPLDELPSLDPELYKNLTFIKHYDGDVSDLELTFSYDEDLYGELITHDLVPGGRTVQVTNENKISYMHAVARFKMVGQIKDQVASFCQGFRSILSPLWLNMFSASELQMLVSGTTDDLDLSDLRRHCQYYGGFHNQHRVINWLWDILDNDFTPAERSLFLKFVTSCSKPPLLGFAHLEPPFSIRCVEVADDHDQGDTVGSVIRGFLSMRKREAPTRLPTSSTCFNLLKLPNYSKKSVLKEKLKYAIHSQTGFELS